MPRLQLIILIMSSSGKPPIILLFLHEWTNDNYSISFDDFYEFVIIYFIIFPVNKLPIIQIGQVIVKFSRQL